MPNASQKQAWDWCEWYDFPRTKELDWLVHLAQQPLPELANMSDPQAHVIALATRMEAAVEAFDESVFSTRPKVASLQLASSCLRALVQKFEAPVPESPAWRLYENLYSECIGIANRFGSTDYSAFGLMEYRASNMYPDPL